MLKKVGFWRRCADWTNRSGWVEAYPELRQPEHHLDPLPEAKDHVDPSWDRNERAVVLAYVTDKKFEDEAYDGWSECRICNEMNGCADFTDGTYVWPEGFGHYISEHDVKPPQCFIDHVLSVPNRDKLVGGSRMNDFKLLRLKKAIRSDYRAGHTHDVGTEGILVERSGDNTWIIELRVPDSSLIGGAWYETLDADGADFELCAPETKPQP